MLHCAPIAERRCETCRNLRIFLVESEHGVSDEIVAGPVGAVELCGIALREGSDERANPVGIGKLESGVGGEGADVAERLSMRDRRLQ